MSDTVTVTSTPTYVTVGSTGTIVTVEEKTIDVVTVGIQGPPGADGVGDKHYEQSFSSTTSLDITHNLNKRPAVTIINSAGDEVVVDIEHISANRLIASWSAAFAGDIFLN